ncbi:MAG: ABC transporter substrate-binding protein [Actinomycetota bacterium]|nr:ABC transporter substrate-binding protein [Actinomycetota bacterium]
MSATRGTALISLLAALALLAAACAGGEGAGAGITTAEPNTVAPATTATSTTTGGGAATSPMLLGLAAPYTGEKSFLGPNLQKGVEVAVAGVNQAGGVAGEDLQLVTADTEGTAQGAIAAVEKLIQQDQVHAMAGPTSVTVMSVLERIQASGVPTMIIAGTAALDDTIRGETTFRGTASDSLVGPAMVQAAVNAGKEECAIVVESLEGAQSVKETIKPAMEALGVELVAEVDIAVGQPSYRSELLQLVEASPGCVFFEISPQSASQFWQNASEFPEVQEMLWVGNDVVLNEDSIAALQPVVEELELVAISPASVGPGREDYLAAYQEMFPDDEEPVILADLGYDATNVLTLAAQAAGSVEHSAIAGKVIEVSREGEACTTFAQCQELLDGGQDVDYQGASGSVNIDETGNSASGFGVFEIEGGQSVQAGEVAEQDVAELVEKLRG